MWFRYLVNNRFRYYSLDELERNVFDSDLINKRYEVRNIYIGAEDKYNTPIYEGDIVRFEITNTEYTTTGNRSIYEFLNRIVKYDTEETEFGADLYFNNEKVDWSQTEVIGNIYYNPELINSCR